MVSRDVDVYTFRSLSKTAQMAVASVRLSFHSLDIHTLVDVLEQTRGHLQKCLHKEPRDAPRDDLRWRIFVILLHILVVTKWDVKL